MHPITWNAGWVSLKACSVRNCKWHYMHSIDRIRVLLYIFIHHIFVFHCNYIHILYRYRDKAKYVSKIAICSCPFYLTTPPRETISNIYINCTTILMVNKDVYIFLCCYLRDQIQIPGLSGDVIDSAKSPPFTHSALQTDGQTDRRKSDLNSGTFA